ncbi:MAG: aminotransferase class V-fold PLP-dependent enzyme, partial [Acidobacteria bacterium]|nr:aminotransferase class V-fold PLP-dependent enzyme [Acidobacteriota bacterium]
MAVYLDCAATAPVDSRVQREVMTYLGVEFGNAGSRHHGFGARARSAVEKARVRVAALVGATRGEIIFTSGATESNNLALLGLAEHGAETGRTHLVSTRIEHKSVLEPLQALSARGFEVTLVAPEAGGWVDPQSILEAVREDTLLVSVMQVNNETGVIQPIREIARLLRNHPAYLHVDAAQGFGKETAPLRDPRIDLISISGHKIYAPKGIGALVTRRRKGQRPPLSPLMHGGGQELGLRPGTLPVPLIAGLGKASELAMMEHEERNAACRYFKNVLLKKLQPLKPVFNGELDRTVPQIVNLTFPGIDSEEAIEAVSGVAAISNGSACTSTSESCSHVLSAQGLDAARMEGALRL